MGVRAYKDLVVGTHPSKLALHAEVMTLRYGYGYTYNQIKYKTGLSHNAINNIIAKYYAKQTGRDLVIIIKSNF